MISNPMNTLRTALVEWTDFDVAAHALAQVLGIFPFDMPMREVKYVYWSNVPLGNSLIQQLERLAQLGVLERREEPDLQYRWCSSYVSR